LCIPASPFFSQERAMQGDSDAFVRIAFCKTDDTIEEAATALSRLTDIAVHSEESAILIT
jgi:kynurenine--oxoglutarate transaminase/cysteine-S-conjugate beta-lyase/glutamine--phenylpyruvate transaminase